MRKHHTNTKKGTSIKRVDQCQGLGSLGMAEELFQTEGYYRKMKLNLMCDLKMDFFFFFAKISLLGQLVKLEWDLMLVMNHLISSL